MRLVLGALAMAGMIDAAGAQGEPPRAAPPPPSGPQRAAPGDLGMAIMSAQVQSDGALLGGAGVLSSTRIATGVYTISFGRNVQKCSAIVTSRVFVNVNYSAQLSGSTARVDSYAIQSTNYADSAFNLVVYCHE